VIHYVAFKTREGMTAYQAADDISTILEAHHKPKGQEPFTTYFLLLRNNNRIEVVDETLETLTAKLGSAAGTQVFFQPLETLAAE
jgi:hypothetical protein